MPKVKTHSGAKKRFKVTAKGKVLAGKSGKRHLLTSKATGRKRNLRGTSAVSAPDAVNVKKMLPYA